MTAILVLRRPRRRRRTRPAIVAVVFVVAAFMLALSFELSRSKGLSPPVAPHELSLLAKSERDRSTSTVADEPTVHELASSSRTLEARLSVARQAGAPQQEPIPPPTPSPSPPPPMPIPTPSPPPMPTLPGFPIDEER